VCVGLIRLVLGERDDLHISFRYMYIYEPGNTRVRRKPPKARRPTSNAYARANFTEMQLRQAYAKNGYMHVCICTHISRTPACVHG
jgi:hypothetical protein